MERLLEALKVDNKKSITRLFTALQQRLSTLDHAAITQYLQVACVPGGDHDSFILLLDHLLSNTDFPRQPILAFIKDNGRFLAGEAKVKSVSAVEALTRWADSGILEVTGEEREGFEARIVELRQVEATRQQRRSFIDYIEKERERLRGLKELDWQRPERESLFAECDEYIDRVKTSDYDIQCIQSELDAFQGINITEPPAKSPRLTTKDTVLIVNLPVFESLNEALMKIVKELADTAFYYRHLQDYNQVHVDYYADEDDHADLRRYDFEKDDLARRPQSRSHFLRERAYRMRKCRHRFDEDRQRSADRLDKATLRRFYKLLQEFGEEVVEAGRVVDQLVGRGFVVAVAVRLHLSIVLALFALLNPRRLTSRSFYSICEKSIDYVKGKLEGERVLVLTSVNDIKSLL